MKASQRSFYWRTSSREAVTTEFDRFWFGPPTMEPKSTVSVADAQFTALLIVNTYINQTIACVQKYCRKFLRKNTVTSVILKIIPDSFTHKNCLKIFMANFSTCIKCEQQNAYFRVLQRKRTKNEKRRKKKHTFY